MAGQFLRLGQGPVRCQSGHRSRWGAAPHLCLQRPDQQMWIFAWTSLVWTQHLSGRYKRCGNAWKDQLEKLSFLNMFKLMCGNWNSWTVWTTDVMVVYGRCNQWKRQKLWFKLNEYVGAVMPRLFECFDVYCKFVSFTVSSGFWVSQLCSMGWKHLVCLQGDRLAQGCFKICSRGVWEAGRHI